MGSYGNSYGFLRQFLWVPMHIPMGSYEHSYGEKSTYSSSYMLLRVLLQRCNSCARACERASEAAWAREAMISCPLGPAEGRCGPAAFPARPPPHRTGLVLSPEFALESGGELRIAPD